MGGFGERNQKGYIILYKVIIIQGESYVMLFQLQLYQHINLRNPHEKQNQFIN